jgi:hypothetical protein
MEVMRDAWKLFYQKTQEKIPLERNMRKWKDNIKIDFGK